MSARSTCAEDGCPQLVVTRGRCAEHSVVRIRDDDADQPPVLVVEDVA
jgi:hypothetical protein